MDEQLFQLFNNMKAELPEVSDVEWDEEEEARAKKRIIEKISGKKHKKTRVYQAAGACAATMAVVLLIGFTHPALARDLFSRTFGRIISSELVAEGETADQKIVSKIGQNSNPVEDQHYALDTETEKDTQYDTEHSTENATESNTEAATETSEQQTGKIVCENAGVSMEVKDIYCDGYVIYYTMELTSAEAKNAGIDWLFSIQDSEGISGEQLLVDGIEYESCTSWVYAQDTTYVAMGVVSLSDLSERTGKTYADGDQIDIAYTVKNGFGSSAGDFRKEGSWSLQFPVIIDAKENQTWEENAAQNGISLKQLTRTKTGVAAELEITCPDGNEPEEYFNNLDVSLYDAQNQFLQIIESRRSDTENANVKRYFIYVLYDGTDELRLHAEAFTGEVIGEVTFSSVAE